MKVSKSKSAKKQYEDSTGDKEPDNQREYDMWYNRYVMWLENKITTISDTIK